MNNSFYPFWFTPFIFVNHEEIYMISIALAYLFFNVDAGYPTIKFLTVKSHDFGMQYVINVEIEPIELQ